MKQLFRRLTGRRDEPQPVPAARPKPPVLAPPGSTLVGMAVYDVTERRPVVWCPEPADPPTRIVVGDKGGDA